MSFRSASVGCLVTLVASVAMAGCGSFKQEDTQALRSTHRQLAEAKRDPAVRRHGAVFLKDAEQTLDRARYVRADPAQSSHLAYLAQRKIEIARSITGLQVAAGNLQALAEKSVATDSLPPREADRTKAADTAAAPKQRTGAAGTKTRAAALPVVATTAAADTRSANSPKPPPESPTSNAVKSGTGTAPDRSTAGLEAGEGPPSQVFAISGVFSDFDRTRLSPDVQRNLTPLVRYLRDNRDSRIIVEGYTGGTGGHEDNLSQSLGIAEAVKSYLTGEGIDGARIFTLGRGANGPVDGTDAAQSGMVNSRIEIGLFQGIDDPTPALSSRTAPSANPSPPPPL